MIPKSFAFHHSYFPSQLVGGLPSGSLLTKPWSQASFLLPPRAHACAVIHPVINEMVLSTSDLLMADIQIYRRR